MTKDEVTRLAHEAAGFDGTTSLERPIVLYAAMSKDFLDKFADLVAEREREACAKVVEDEWGRWAVPVNTWEYNQMWDECAKAIRARGET